MKKILRVAVALTAILWCSLASAQNRVITGTVKDDKGNALPAVAVQVKGTTMGTYTDNDGKFSLSVPPEYKVLTFHYTGMKNVELAVTDNMVVNMVPDALGINEIVVTALGVKREQKELGFSNQTLNGSEVSTAKEANVINSLEGKVAGVQVTGNSNLGGSSRITIRGIKSLYGQNQPLIVIDGIIFDNSNFKTLDESRGAFGYDYGNAASDINSDDIETINVLKGTTAAALYGSRGANGAIVITTKKGARRPKNGSKSPIGVSFSSSYMISEIATLPKYQNQYGGGYSPSFVPLESGQYKGDSTSHRVRMEDDGSWGPAMKGQIVRQYGSFYTNDPTYGKGTPFLPHPDNIKDFFVKGGTANNNIALDGANDKGSFRLSYSNLYQTGTVPNSYLQRNSLNFNSTYNFTDRLYTIINANYINDDNKGRPAIGYNSLFSNFTQWWERSLDMSDLKNYKNPDGSQRAWNLTLGPNGKWVPYFWDNPYWTVNENYESDHRDRVFGNLEAGYKITGWLTAIGRTSTDFYQELREERIAVGSATASSNIPMYSMNQITNQETNSDFRLLAHKLLDNKFDLTGFLGVNRMDQSNINNFTSTQGGLNIPEWYTLANSVGKVLVDDAKRVKRINSTYGAISLGYKGFLFIDVTGRNDWSSTLPSNNNSYFYPSATGSFIFSDILKLDKWLSYGKLRGGWSLVGNDTDPYRLDTRLNSSQSFGNMGVFVVPNTFNNPALKPEQIRSWEIGTDLSFLLNRISAGFTYYNTQTKDNIFPIQVSGASGTVYQYANSGILDNHGVELTLSVTPLKYKNFSWVVGANFAHNYNEVKELYKNNGNDISSLLIGSAPFRATLEAIPGMAYGQIMGTNFVYDKNGNKIVDPSTGYYVQTAKNVPLGSILPQYTGGFYTVINYKWFSLYALIDFQKGGKIFSLTNMWGKYDGTLAETADNGVREKGVVLPGVVQTGTDANGNPISDGTKNTKNIAAIDAYNNTLNGYFGPTATDVYDASFVKFRELRLMFNFPTKWFDKTFIRGMSFGIIGRNLFIISKNVPNIDPETANSTGNLQGFEGGNKPSERTYGFNFKFNF